MTLNFILQGPPGIMSFIWTPSKDPPHPSYISGLSRDADIVWRALKQKHLQDKRMKEMARRPIGNVTIGKCFICVFTSIGPPTGTCSLLKISCENVYNHSHNESWFKLRLGHEYHHLTPLVECQIQNHSVSWCL